jgi:hypothetical protein
MHRLISNDFIFLSFIVNFLQQYVELDIYCELSLYSL